MLQYLYIELAVALQVLVNCTLVLCYGVTMVGPYGVMGRRLTDPAGFYLHSSVVLCAERVLSRKNRHWNMSGWMIEMLPYFELF
jgi:hypothetical protein